jgi:altronate hydrolase
MTETMTRPEGKTLVLSAADNIAVALANLEVGTQTPEGVSIIRRVPRGHKFTTRPIGAGEAVIKFGQIIGFAKEGIAPGDWVHEHNCGMGGAGWFAASRLCLCRRRGASGLCAG